MRRWIALGISIGILGGSSGCGLGPRNFRKIRHPSPLVRARALSLGDRRPITEVAPALIARLDDPDPVVRLAAHEELKERTGRDFGYVPWDEEPERRVAVERWRAWLSGRPPVAQPAPPPVAPGKALPAPAPAPSPQHQPTIRQTAPVPSSPTLAPTRYRRTIRG